MNAQTTPATPTEPAAKPTSAFGEICKTVIFGVGALTIGTVMSGPIADFAFSKIEGKPQYGRSANMGLQLCASETTPKLLKPLVCFQAGANVAATGVTGTSPGFKIAPQ